MRTLVGELVVPVLGCVAEEQCVAACCSVLQHIAVCCSVLQCIVLVICIYMLFHIGPLIVCETNSLRKFNVDKNRNKLSAPFARQKNNEIEA